jgi:hypothetical protein
LARFPFLATDAMPPIIENLYRAVQHNWPAIATVLKYGALTAGLTFGLMVGAAAMRGCELNAIALP